MSFPQADWIPIILLRRVTGPKAYWNLKTRSCDVKSYWPKNLGEKDQPWWFLYTPVCMYRHIYVHIYTCLSMPVLEFFSQLVLALNQIQHFETCNMTQFIQSIPWPIKIQEGLGFDCGFCPGEVAQSTKLKNAIMEVFSVLTWRQWRPPDFVVRIECKRWEYMWSLRCGLARLRLYT